ncbi:MAG: fumarate hydratase C-terminal domain-containing protein [Candidatus Omnitrophica bacterium]|nr:fumarate hydratase C-terminal domain-containing protein [Candidatus Omnitrophota bacterium]
MRVKKIVSPLERKEIKKLKAGDEVLLSGIIYTARDAAHKRMVKGLKRRSHSDPRAFLRKQEQGEESLFSLPFDLRGQVIYYTGPTPAPPGKIIGSCGPTTSYRMDPYTPTLLRLGLKGVIGKGDRSKEVVEAIKKYQALYFIALGGCGALYSQFVKKAGLIAYPDLGCEAILKLEVEDFPLIVGIDTCGRDIYKFGV